MTHERIRIKMIGNPLKNGKQTRLKGVPVYHFDAGEVSAVSLHCHWRSREIHATADQ